MIMDEQEMSQNEIEVEVISETNLEEATEEVIVGGGEEADAAAATENDVEATEDENAPTTAVVVVETTEETSAMEVEGEAQNGTEAEAKTDEPKRVSTKNQLYVGNLPYTQGEEGIKAYFEKFGEIAKFTLSKTKKKKDGKQGHRGFAFVCYANPEHAKIVLEKKDHKIDDREVVVKTAKPKTTKFFVGGINKEKTSKKTLNDFFKKFGEIEDVYCVNARGFAFVTMVEDGDNIKKILEAGKFEIDGSSCDIKPAQKREEMRRNAARGGRRGGRSRGRGKKAGGRGGFGTYGMMPYGSGFGGPGAYAAWTQQAAQYQQFAAQSYHPYGGYGGQY